MTIMKMSEKRKYYIYVWTHTKKEKMVEVEMKIIETIICSF